MILRKILLLALLFALAAPAFADKMLMGRIANKADVAMEMVQDVIREHGYEIAHIQLCDGGMETFGYKSDVYRVIFFGKGEEVRRISKTNPEFVAYLPLKIAVIAEKDDTMVTIVNPLIFNNYYPNDEDMKIQFGRWYNDIMSIFNDLQIESSSGAMAMAH